MSSFRLAGVDSQVVNRVLELYSHEWFANDTQKSFTSKEDAYEFIYLLIVLQTCQHNPQIKDKTSLKTFKSNAALILPKSIKDIPEDFLEDMY